MIFITSTCSKILGIKSIMRARVYCLFHVCIWEIYDFVSVICLLIKHITSNKYVVAIHHVVQFILIKGSLVNFRLEIET